MNFKEAHGQAPRVLARTSLLLQGSPQSSAYRITSKIAKIKKGERAIGKGRKRSPARKKKSTEKKSNQKAEGRIKRWGT